MMLRLISIFLILVLFLAFIIFNLENRCDVSLGFITFKDIPVFLTAIFSFTLGLLFAIPLVVCSFLRRKKSSHDKMPPKADPHGNTEPLKKVDGTYGFN